jgi:tetratricopeptide (TPR) repeat protein
MARAHLNLGVNLASLGETEESIASSRTALALYDRMCVPASAGLARNNLAIALVDAGLLDEAERQVTEAQRLSERFGGLYYRFETELTRARLAQRRGEMAEARARAEVAVALAAGSPVDAATAKRTLAALMSMGGDHEAARRALDEAAATLGDADLGEAARIVAERGRVALRRGDPAAGEPLLTEAARRLADLGASLDLRKLRDATWI